MDRSVPPRVSIIILNWNKSSLTIECVEAVRRNTHAVTYEIIVVDNGSASSERETLRKGLRDVRLVSLSENMFFGEGNNIGAEVACGEFLLFLNNDAFVSPNCIDDLVANFATCFSAGAIGPKFLNPDGTLQEAGAFLRPGGWPIQQGRNGLPLAAHFDHGCHIVDYCSAACLMIRRTVFLTLAGFDPLFDPAYFEDADLCLRLRSMGLYVYYAADISVVHIQNATSMEMWTGAGLNEIFFGNHRKFLDRWGDYLSNRLEDDIPFPRVALAPDIRPVSERTGAKRILLRSKNNIRMAEESYALLRHAAELSRTCRVVIATPEICSRLRIRSICQKLSVTLRDFDQARLESEKKDSYAEVISYPLNCHERSRR